MINYQEELIDVEVYYISLNKPVIWCWDYELHRVLIMWANWIMLDLYDFMNIFYFHETTLRHAININTGVKIAIILSAPLHIHRD